MIPQITLCEAMHASEAVAVKRACLCGHGQDVVAAEEGFLQSACLPSQTPSISLAIRLPPRYTSVFEAVRSHALASHPGNYLGT